MKDSHFQTLIEAVSKETLSESQAIELVNMAWERANHKTYLCKNLEMVFNRVEIKPKKPCSLGEFLIGQDMEIYVEGSPMGAFLTQATIHIVRDQAVAVVLDMIP